MKFIKIIIFALIYNLSFSQQYDSVKLETENIDSDNLIYKTGNVYIFDYEIIENGKSFKLKTNNSEKFELVGSNDSSILVKNIHLIIEPQIDSLRTNENQTQIIYFQLPQFSSFSGTGLVENKDNIWMHPIRDGFFRCLETCPFPFIKYPLKKSKTWTDEMLIGENWGNEKWGKWKGSLLLKYEYKIVRKRKIDTEFGKIKCYVIESTAESAIGKTKLVSFFSEQYGFIRFEYSLLNNIKVNIWLTEYMKDKIFNNQKDFFRTKKYLKY
jgi:hypothetical protein